MFASLPCTTPSCHVIPGSPSAGFAAWQEDILQQSDVTRYQTVKPQIRPSTWRRYSDFVRVHLVPALGRTTLAKLTPQHLQALYASKLMSGLSSTTVRHIYATLHRALKDALL